MHAELQKARADIASAYMRASKLAGIDGLPADAVNAMLETFNILDHLATRGQQSPAPTGPEPQERPHQTKGAAIEHEMRARLVEVLNTERVP